MYAVIDVHQNIVQLNENVNQLNQRVVQLSCLNVVVSLCISV